ncbi:MAG TPA: hypothetical protein VLV86_05795 [Vicinamibacterales bacterium]|nr:hypothetical protein [Vicinamibacterales bacterium]
MSAGHWRTAVMFAVATGLTIAGHSSVAIAGRLNVEAAVNDLLITVKQSVTDPAVPPFARERIAWLTKAQRGGALSIVLLRHTASAGLDDEALMASGHADGRLVIVIARAQFERLLAEGDRLCEEERAWRTVDMQVVRPLLVRHEPMNRVLSMPTPHSERADTGSHATH